jgi:hypothetical protein
MLIASLREVIQAQAGQIQDLHAQLQQAAAAASPPPAPAPAPAPVPAGPSADDVRLPAHSLLTFGN